MGHLSTHMRHRVVLEYERLKHVNKVANKLGIKWHTANTWIKRFKTTGGVESKAGSGRKPRLSQKAAQAAHEMLLSGDVNGAQQVASELHKAGHTPGDLPTDRTTVARHAKAYGMAVDQPIKCVRSKPKKQLTAATKAKRLAFCSANKRREWRFVMFTDRKKFHFNHPGVSVKQCQWVEAGKEREANTVNHAMTVNMYAGITKYGVTEPHLVAGTSKLASPYKTKKGTPAKNITAEEYEQVLKQTLLPEGKRIFSNQGVSKWVLQQDNDPTHKRAAGKVLQQWNASVPCPVSLLSWPPNSPDLSPIENLWSDIQAKADAAGCKTFDEFQQTVVALFKSTPRSTLTNLYKSMKRRLEECRNMGGAKTRY